VAFSLIEPSMHYERIIDSRSNRKRWISLNRSDFTARINDYVLFGFDNEKLNSDSFAYQKQVDSINGLYI